MKGPIIPPAWLRLIAVGALLRIAVGVPGPWLASEPAGREPFSEFFFVLIIGVFTASAAVLLTAGRTDERASTLAVLFLLSAVPFTDGLLALVEAGIGGGRLWIQILRRLSFDAFLPYVWWAFVAVFPRREPFARGARIATFGTALSLWIGVALFVANLAMLFELPSSLSWASSLLDQLDRTGVNSQFYAIIFVLVLPATAFAIWRTEGARIEEKRRVRLLVFGSVIFGLPTIVLSILMPLWPSLRNLTAAPGVLVVQLIAYPTLLSIPLVTTYAVLVDRALDVRLVIRKALQRSIARYSVWGLAALAFGTALVFLVASRDQTLGEILSGGGAVGLITALAIGLLVVGFRDRLLEPIDRVFFRESYQSHRLLTNLIEKIRRPGSLPELAAVLANDIDEALHLTACDLYFLDPTSDLLVSPLQAHQPLSADSTLVRELVQVGGPLSVDWGKGDGVPLQLPADEQEWLADSAFRLMVPFIGSSGAALGFLGIGDKLSELPFSQEDEELLVAIAASVSLHLESRLPKEVGPAPEAVQPAMECVDCGTVRPESANGCPECGGRTNAASVPLVLGGKYVLDRRIGEGGMGRVYLAVDRALDRPVAVKSLPRVSPRRSQMLRREARAMAAVSHPNLAMIFAVEFWKSAPLLVVEYLPQGTLADRLSREALSVDAAITTVMSITEAVSSLHGTGMLHRDIKPSNVGYARDGTLKLLDFGLAKMFEVASDGEVAGTSREIAGTVGEIAGTIEEIAGTIGEEATGGSDTPADPLVGPGSGSWTDGVAGTVDYMSPQALAKERPDPSFDLWSIGVILYELVGGRRPAGDGPPVVVAARILRTQFPDVRELRPDTPPAVVELIEDCLAVQPGRRPASANALLRRLRSLQIAGEP